MYNFYNYIVAQVIFDSTMVPSNSLGSKKAPIYNIGILFIVIRLVLINRINTSYRHSLDELMPIRRKTPTHNQSINVCSIIY